MIRLRTLGALDLGGADGRELRGVLAQPKRAALLVYLTVAARRAPCRRDSLLALFWPELDADRARNALNQAVHFLRRSLGADVLVSNNGDELSVHSSDLWCDATAFDEAVDAGRSAEALELYRGELLEGFHVANAPEFERWVESERSRLGGRFARAVAAAAAERERMGDFAGSVAYWRRLAARDPYSSPTALGLMRAMAAAGDAPGAVRHSRVHETLLREELALAPDAGVAALVRELQTAPAAERRTISSGAAAPSSARSIVDTGSVETKAAPTPVVDRADPADNDGSRSPAPAPHDAELSRYRSRRRVVIAARLVGLVAAAVVAIIVGPIAREMLVAATPQGRAQRATGGPRDFISREQYLRELYTRGRRAEVSRSAIGMQTATLHYRRAIAEDSGFALAYAGLAENYALQAHYDYMPKSVALDSAWMMAQRAVALDDTLPEARVALALALGNAGQFGLAEREFRAAVELSPSNAVVRYWYGMFLVTLGRGPEALEQAELALKLNPLAPRAALSTKRYAVFLITGKRPHLDLPVQERRPILGTEPGEPWARARDAAELAEEGNCSDARSELRRTQQLVPDSTNMVLREFVGRVDWACEERPRARALLAQMKREPEVNDHALRVANLHVRFGEPDLAIEWLGRHRWTISELAMLRGDPGLDPLRSDPKFAELLVRIGIQGRPQAAALSSR